MSNPDRAWTAEQVEQLSNALPDAYVEQAVVLDAYAATLRQQAEREGWLPIATAPRDGTRVLAYAEREGYEPVTISCYVLDARGQNGVWAMTGPRVIPTLWQPLPGDPVQRVCPVLVDADTDASEANAQYGESYGVDWVYKPKQAERGDGAVTKQLLAVAVCARNKEFTRAQQAGEQRSEDAETRAALEAVAPLLRAPAESPCSLDEALNVIERWCMKGYTLQGDDAGRFRALADKVAPAEQGGRVDWSAWLESQSDDDWAVLFAHRPDLKERLQAALAQNAQGAVAWMAIHPGIGDVALFTEFPQNYADAGVKVTPLYTHAEHTRVPTDSMLAAFVHTWNGGVEWLPATPNLTKRQLARARMAYNAFLAAAPSQPEDADHE